MSCVKQRSPFSTVGVYTVCVCVCLCMRSYFVSPCKCMVIRFIFIFIFKDSGEQTGNSKRRMACRKQPSADSSLAGICDVSAYGSPTQPGEL